MSVSRPRNEGPIWIYVVCAGARYQVRARADQQPPGEPWKLTELYNDRAAAWRRARQLARERGWELFPW